MPAYLMDDLSRWSGPIRERSLFLMPFDRRHSWVDPAEVGEAAANIIISRDDRHIGQYYDVECGHEVLRFGDVANMFSDVFRGKFIYVNSPETWRSLADPHYKVLFVVHDKDSFLAFNHFDRPKGFWKGNTNVFETFPASP